MIKYVSNEINVYILESNKLHDYVKRMDMMTVYSSLACEDIRVNTEFKVLNW